MAQVVNEMPNRKSHGLDGFIIGFFKACWETVKTNIYEVVVDSQNSTTILKAIIFTFITLIPKEDRASTLEKFRPIALCNVLYKIISKVAANRMKMVLPFLISKAQSRFMEGRKILDNVIHAHEIDHSLKRP